MNTKIFASIIFISTMNICFALQKEQNLLEIANKIINIDDTVQITLALQGADTKATAIGVGTAAASYYLWQKYGKKR